MQKSASRIWEDKISEMSEVETVVEYLLFTLLKMHTSVRMVWRVDGPS